MLLLNYVFLLAWVSYSILSKQVTPFALRLLSLWMDFDAGILSFNRIGRRPLQIKQKTLLLMS